MRVLLLLLALSACKKERQDEAYVWRHQWTPAVGEAIESTDIKALRVLAVEVGAGETWMKVEPAALRGRDITLVARVDGTAPVAGFSLKRLAERAEALRGEGVTIVGLEVDHDCATSKLPRYRAWLIAQRGYVRGRLSITALPTWSTSEDLVSLVAAVDEVVLQVHAVEAPTLFDAAWAQQQLTTFEARAHRQVAVALPTYHISDRQRADPEVLQAFARSLARKVVWFRLPIADDGQTWTPPTFRAVRDDKRLRAEVRFRLDLRAPKLYDIQATNQGTLDAPWRRPQIRGVVEAADWLPARPLRAGESRVIGWVRGEVRLAN